MKSLAQLVEGEKQRQDNLVKLLNAKETALALELDGLRSPLQALLSGPYGASRRKAVRAQIARGNPYASARLREIALAHWKDRHYYLAVTRWLEAEWEFAMACDEASAALDVDTASGAALEHVHMPLSQQAAVRQRMGQTVIGPQLSRLEGLREALNNGRVEPQDFERERLEIEGIVADARRMGYEVTAATKGCPPTVAAYLSEALLAPLILAGFGTVGAPTIADAMRFVRVAADLLYIGVRRRHIAGHAPREVKLTENGLRAAATIIRKRAA